MLLPLPRYLDAMRVSIDASGRVVIPKRVREELGLKAGQELELDTRDGDIRLSAHGVDMWVEGEGREARLRTAAPLPPLAPDVVSRTLDELRSERLHRW
jgi:AbrB family looped-hinge helix DNA binding protein